MTQDKIPPWAEALVDRVNTLEKATSSSVRSSGAATPALSLNEFASDER